MKVLVIGATGNIGRHTVNFALAMNHTVTAFGRSVGNIEKTHPNLRITKGDVLKEADVALAVEGQDVVILTFGAPLNANTIFHVPDLCERGTRNVIAQMKRAQVDRLICMTAIGAGDSKGHGRFIFRNIIEPVLLGRIMEDRTQQEMVVKDASLPEWIIVRPTELNDADSKPVRIIENLKAEKEPETISREDVGKTLAKLIGDHTFDQKTILITH